MRRALLVLCTTIAATATSGCVRHLHHRAHGAPAPIVVSKPGPPPHAPAHGYRHKHHHHGVELVFDSHLGVYAVIGWDDVFFHRDHFYRIVDGGWQISMRLNDGWAHAHPGKLPKGLGKKALGAKRHGKGHHPAKRRHHGHRPAKHHY